MESAKAIKTFFPDLGATMSLQVRRFLAMLEENASNEVISYAWEQLTLRERTLAVLMAEADKTDLIADSQQSRIDEEWLLVA